MSGGYFEYKDSYYLQKFINEIRVALDDNKTQKKVLKKAYDEHKCEFVTYETYEPKETLDQFGEPRWVRDYRLTKKQIKLLEDTIFDCEILKEKLHIIDWCFSGDTGKDYLERNLIDLSSRQTERYGNKS